MDHNEEYGKHPEGRKREIEPVVSPDVVKWQLKVIELQDELLQLRRNEQNWNGIKSDPSTEVVELRQKVADLTKKFEEERNKSANWEDKYQRAAREIEAEKIRVQTLANHIAKKPVVVDNSEKVDELEQTIIDLKNELEKEKEVHQLSKTKIAELESKNDHDEKKTTTSNDTLKEAMINTLLSDETAGVNENERRSAEERIDALFGQFEAESQQNLFVACDFTKKTIQKRKNSNDEMNEEEKKEEGIMKKQKKTSAVSAVDGVEKGTGVTGSTSASVCVASSTVKEAKKGTGVAGSASGSVSLASSTAHNLIPANERAEAEAAWNVFIKQHPGILTKTVTNIFAQKNHFLNKWRLTTRAGKDKFMRDYGVKQREVKGEEKAAKKPLSTAAVVITISDED